MVRLSDFVWDSDEPPQSIEYNAPINISRKLIPGKRGNLTQDVGIDNTRISVGGKFHSIPTDTDRHYTNMLELTEQLNKFKPLTFTHNAFSPFGEDGDNFSDYVNTTAMDVDWTMDGPTRAIEDTIVKVGDYSIKITGTDVDSGVAKLTFPSALNLNLPQYGCLCFWMRAGSLTDDDDFNMWCVSTGGNGYSQGIDVSEVFPDTSTWVEFVLPVGSGAAKTTVANTPYKWRTTGSPDWESITYIDFNWGASSAGTWYIDGLCFTTGVVIHGIPSLVYPPGKPHQHPYRFDLEQLLQ